MELISHLALGFSVSPQPLNLLLCFVGVGLGVIIGIVPGLGSAATIALLLPITYFLDTTTAVIMLAGIWYGSMYGGSITSILLHVPGESASVMVAIDGYELTKRGRAGACTICNSGYATWTAASSAPSLTIWRGSPWNCSANWNSYFRLPRHQSRTSDGDSR